MTLPNQKWVSGSRIPRTPFAWQSAIRSGSLSLCRRSRMRRKLHLMSPGTKRALRDAQICSTSLPYHVSCCSLSVPCVALLLLLIGLFFVLMHLFFLCCQWEWHCIRICTVNARCSPCRIPVSLTFTWLQ